MDKHVGVTFKLLAGLLLIFSPIGLISCSGSDYEGTEGPNVSIAPNITEGEAPLEVTFVVEGDGIREITWDFGDGAFTTSSSSITHVFNTPGNFQVSAQVQTIDPVSIGNYNTTINVTEPPAPPTPPPDVNLIVSSFAIDREITAGSLETVSAIIQNIGSTALNGRGGVINVGYYLSTDNVIAVDDILIGDTSILVDENGFSQEEVPFGFETLGPGDNYQFDHQLAIKGNIPSGTYYAGAIVDFIDEYEWYTFPRSTDTEEYPFPRRVIVEETDETDNVRVLPAYQVVVNNAECLDDAFEADDDSSSATLIAPGETQAHNFCFDNADWLRFEAVQGAVYKITTSQLDPETDTQLILYDRDAESILLFHDNLGNEPTGETETVDLSERFPAQPSSEIVWEAEHSGTYFIKVRTTACDEDLDDHCDGPEEEPGIGSPDGVGLSTGYSITLE